MPLVSLFDKISLFATVVSLPAVCSWRLAMSFFFLQERRKTWRRVVFDSIPRWFTASLTIPQLANVTGSSQELYEAWMKKNALAVCVEDIGENSRLLWIGKENSQRTILYLHGGGFSSPLMGASIPFWRYVQQQLHKTADLDVAIAILDYTIIPHAHFPVPLRQTVTAVNHLLSVGIEPENIVITGDSAGGNLCLQLLLHMKRPIPGLPQTPPTKFGGVYLMSPWLDIQLRRPTPSNMQNDRWDIITKEKLQEFARRVLDGVQEQSQLPYVDAHFTPDEWYNELDEVAGKLLISAGEMECLRDDILRFGEKIQKRHPRAEVVLDINGVHDDPFFNFLAGEKKLGQLTPIIIEWCKGCFGASRST